MALLLVGASPTTFTSFEAHTHDCFEIILNTQGEGTAEIGGAEYPFSPGTIHVVPPNTPHGKRSAGGFRDLYLHTDTLRWAESAVQTEKAIKEPLVLADDTCRTMESILNILLARYLQSSKTDAVMEALYQVVLMLLEEWSRSAPPDPVISGIIDTITASYSNPEFQVTDALTATGYSKDHIRRRFHQVTGQTPNAYLKSVRIRYAKSLLLQKERLHLTINDVARMSGYYDVAYFCRSFRKETGMTPMEFAQKG